MSTPTSSPISGRTSTVWDVAVIGGGPPLADARAFAQWRAAHRLVERGATITMADAATLGLMDRLAAYFDGPGPPPSQDDIDRAFWGACHWENLTPLDAGRRSNAHDVEHSLIQTGARAAPPAAEGPQP